MAPAEPKLRAGEEIGGFVVDSHLSSGGMGQIYLVRDTAGGPFALKLAEPELAADERFLRRFEREATAAGAIDHPHVVPVVALGEHDGLPYLVQQFMPGGSLAELLHREGQLGADRALEICSQVAAGLEALHSAGLVHRDLQPSNILFDVDGSARIADLGLVKTASGAALTEPGQVIGALDYMAPEQVRGEEVTPATDTYALGCVVCECLSGSPPFADHQGMRVLWAHLQVSPPNPADRGAAIDPALGAAVLRALAKDPAERPAGAGRFARMLEAVHGGGEN